VGNQRLKVIGDMASSGFGTTTNLDLGYTYDQEGRLIESGTPAGGPHYRYTFDNMGRATGLWEDGQSQPSATATYGIAGEVTGLTYWAVAENRSYNNMFQLTRMTANAFGTTVMDMQYNYTSGQNNGRISSSVDGYLSETVNYAYDALNRLSSATATNGAWGQSFAYDGFGNLTDKTATVGSAPTLHVTFDPATNRQTGVTYDANGDPTDNKVYDVENRLVSVPDYQSYQYDYRGKRITKLMGSTTELYLYGIDGRKVATYQCGDVSSYQQFTCGSPTFDTYWKGKLVKSKGLEVTTDRLGSVRWVRDTGWSSYFPYGEDRGGLPDNREKFGTYLRDNSGQDYADQRYYGVGTGRFHTPDPYMNSAGIGDPGSWNRFAYVQGDPLNAFDPSGNNTIYVNFGVDIYNNLTVPVFTVTVTAQSEPVTPGAAQMSRDFFDGVPQIDLGSGGEQSKPPDSGGAATVLKEVACSAVPDGRTIGVAANLGFLGGPMVSAEVVLDYHSGNASLVLAAGMNAIGSGASIGASTGYIWGQGDSAESYKTGGSTSASFTVAGVTYSATTNSGGITGNPAALAPMQATAVAFGMSLGMQSFLNAGVAASNTVKIVELGSFVTGAAANMAWANDYVGYGLQQACKQ
jgi:RHS repeat-associated protein